MKLLLPMRAVTLAAFLSLSLAAGSGAQQLWTVDEVVTRPALPLVLEGVPVSTAAATSAPAAEVATVQVAYDYLRVGMRHLELLLPDGATVAVENAVFKDRGDGNLMWTGRMRGAEYESVVFTLQNGFLIGHFGSENGPNYTVYASPDGNGKVAIQPTRRLDFKDDVSRDPRAGFAYLLGNLLLAERHPGKPEPSSENDSSEVTICSKTACSKTAFSTRDDQQLDILMVYTDKVTKYWQPIGGPDAKIQALIDYLNMVFRNNRIPVTARAIPLEWVPEIGYPPLDPHTARISRWNTGIGALSMVEADPFIDRHRVRLGADLWHYFSYPLYDPYHGGRSRHIAKIMYSGARFGTGSYLDVTWAGAPTFAHGVGHNLGADHEPAISSCCGPARRSICGTRLPPHNCGHTELTATPRPIHTIMSYGGVPEGYSYSETVPYYSSVRLQVRGASIGRTGISEVERVFRDLTVPRAVQMSDIASSRERASTGDLRGSWIGRSSVRLDWTVENDQTVSVDVLGGLDGGYYEIATWDSTRVDEHWFEDWVLDHAGRRVGVVLSGLRPGGRYRFFTWAYSEVRSDILTLEFPRNQGPRAPSNVTAAVAGTDAVHLTWSDNSDDEAGFEIWLREYHSSKVRWRRYGDSVPENTISAKVEGLQAVEEFQSRQFRNDDSVKLTSKRGRYSFVVVAHNDRGWNASETFDLEFYGGAVPEQTVSGEFTDCQYRQTGLELAGGYEVEACLETPDGVRRRVWDYRLEADQSALLYFFSRDNAEILVKMVDGCAINGHRWVFVAPVTTLPFRLRIRRPGDLGASLGYDSERGLLQEWWSAGGNRKDQTASPASDTKAYPCTTAEVVAAKAVAAISAPEFGISAVGLAEPSFLTRLNAGAHTDCIPGDSALTLRGGYTVSMCYETYDGTVGNARDFGLDSSQSGLLYFFERDNVEVLIKVLDGCGVNGHRWVFVAPVTDLAFNLHVTGPDGKIWTHTNRLGQTADAASDTAAFPCRSA